MTRVFPKKKQATKNKKSQGVATATAVITKKLRVLSFCKYKATTKPNTRSVSTIEFPPLTTEIMGEDNLTRSLR